MKEDKILEFKKAELTSQITEVNSVLNNSYNNLQLAQNSHLLDYYAYKIKAEEALHQFLIEEFKKLEN